MVVSVEAIKMAITELCKEKGISVNRLSEQAGLRNSTVSAIMNGRSKNPTMNTLEKIAKGFGVEFEYFVSRVASVQDGIEQLSLLHPYIPMEDGGLDVAVRLNSLRLERGLTIQEVCDATGLPSNFEKLSTLSNIVLAELCSFFNISADYILGLTDEPRPLIEPDE